MVTFDCSAHYQDGVTLVTASLHDIAVPTRVTVRNCLDGPVWPPRSEGLAEAGWTSTGFSGVLEPGSHALGYATPARPEETPAELAEAVAVPEADPVGQSTGCPADVVRELGDPAPPGDAVPAAAFAGPPSSPTPSSSEDSTGPDSTSDIEGGQTSSSGTDGEQSAPLDSVSNPRDADGREDHTVTLPPAVGPWLAKMERRADTAEALAAAETVPEATAAIREVGGLAEVRELADAGDERRLRLLARRARRLADRRAGATIPAETLSRLA